MIQILWWKWSDWRDVKTYVYEGSIRLIQCSERTDGKKIFRDTRLNNPFTWPAHNINIPVGEIADLEPETFTEYELAIIKMIKDGKKIHAIKEWRAKFEIGLVESKDAVEALEKRAGLK